MGRARRALGLKRSASAPLHDCAGMGASAVYGMPKAAASDHCRGDILRVDRIAAKLMDVLKWATV